MQKLQRLFIIALFGAIIFVANMFLPPPLNYLMMVVQAVLLALSGLFIHKVGAMYVGAVGGLLTALVSPALGPFTFFFAFLFGVFVDVFLFALQNQRFTTRSQPQPIDGCHGSKHAAYCCFKLLCICHFSPILHHGLSYCSLFVQRSPMLDVLVLFMGPVTGAVAGYAAAYLWNKYLRHICV